MKLLTDFHHHALAESIMMLFQDRNGVEVFFPVGMEWFDSGIWQFEKAWYGDLYARKYLVDKWKDSVEIDGIFSKEDDRYPGRILKGLSLDTARSIGIDIILSTLPHNDIGFHLLSSQIGARFGVQVGNAGQQSRWDLASFILLSATAPGYENPSEWGKVFTWNGKNSIIYHQEFDSKNIFCHDINSAIDSNIAASFVTRMAESNDYSVFKRIANENLNDFSWRVYGSYGAMGPDVLSYGDLVAAPDIAQAMKRTRIGFHIKSVSDGFGHAIHNWAAIGRPIFWAKSFYIGRLASALWEDNTTSWNIESMTSNDITRTMIRLRDDNDFWIETSLKIRNRFDNLISFDDESKEIANMLGIG